MVLDPTIEMSPPLPTIRLSCSKPSNQPNTEAQQQIEVNLVQTQVAKPSAEGPNYKSGPLSPENTPASGPLSPCSPIISPGQPRESSRAPNVGDSSTKSGADDYGPYDTSLNLFLPPEEPQIENESNYPSIVRLGD
ncbi:hypothetical protein M9H77_27337 [Catharanthus roseus]|uniref:Uncharacterized protein n=1 Tax=Catharanthus roseus TaxID=4058 RepID=A0ACC0AEC8_CATRO|nr:hypothetical protein M9H77_27337 [Catharanthus roseus]